MATEQAALRREVSSPLASVDLRTERWFFAAMALLYFATALAGFIPTSIEKVGAVSAGQRPPFPWFMHVHALLMGAWLCLLLVQTLIVAKGRVSLHRSLGVLAFFMLPPIVLTMGVMTVGSFFAIAAMPPGAMPSEVLAATKAFVTNLVLAQVQSIVLFPLFIGWALAVRKSDPAMHKRLMLFGTLFPLVAGIDRLTERLGLTTQPESGDSMYLNILVWIAPALLFDLLRTGRVHRAYLYGLGCVVPCFVITHLLWGTPAWRAVVSRAVAVMGIANW